MLTVDEARRVIQDAIRPLGSELIDVHEAHGRVLSKDIVANRAQPPFHSSAMDGFAVHFETLRHYSEGLTVVGESRAGSPYKGSALKADQTVLIYTGAELPAGTDTVIIQENARLIDGKLTWSGTPKQGQHVRQSGSDFQNGQTLISKGQRLDAQHLALAIAGNNEKLSVSKRPKIALLITGDELKPVGSELKPTDILNSNERMLCALFSNWGADVVYSSMIGDDKALLIKNISTLSSNIDLVVSVGGASVGKYDYLKDALNDMGSQMMVAKVAMRPGKPFFFSRTKSGAPFFGLPGNPVSAFVTALLFVVPSILQMTSAAIRSVPTFKALLLSPIKINGDREAFLRGRATIGEQGRLQVNPLDSSDSAALLPLSEANCLINIPAHAGPFESGETVTTILFSTP